MLGCGSRWAVLMGLSSQALARPGRGEERLWLSWNQGAWMCPGPRAEAPVAWWGYSGARPHPWVLERWGASLAGSLQKALGFGALAALHESSSLGVTPGPGSACLTVAGLSWGSAGTEQGGQ